MAWWTKSGWRGAWGTRAWRKKSARVASRREDRKAWDDLREDDRRDGMMRSVFPYLGPGTVALEDDESDGPRSAP